MRMPGFSAESSLYRTSSRFEHTFSESDLKTNDVLAALSTLRISCVFQERLLKLKDPSKKDCKLICDSKGNIIRWRCPLTLANTNDFPEYEQDWTEFREWLESGGAVHFDQFI
jgi:hypothetical protein